MKDKYTFIELLPMFRKRAGLTQAQLAAKLGVHRNTVLAWENGKQPPGSRNMVLDLADTLELDQADTDRLLLALNYVLEHFTPTPPPNAAAESAGSTSRSAPLEKWDVFISHASEDKETIARPLAKALEAKGLRVWFDEFTLSVGDRLRRSIDRGLANSRYGIVILSPMFFAKEWPQKELDGLTQREERGEKVILPVWHNITAAQIRAYSPILADRIAVLSDRGLDYVVAELLRAMGVGPNTPNLVRILLPIEMDLVRIPAGEFLMGSDPAQDGEAKENEQPQHLVYLDEYCIGKYPVTNAQYSIFVEAGKHRAPGHWFRGKLPTGLEEHPVVDVSWNDATAFCQWLAKESGGGIRLPTEAEWEKAARGTDGRIYSWGNQPPDGTRCNYGRNVGGTTTPVGQYPAGISPYGVWDMSGNVFEWCSDWYDKTVYQTRADNVTRSPTGPGAGVYKALRGGPWWIDREFVRCASRDKNDPGYWADFCGFRVASGPFQS